MTPDEQLPVVLHPSEEEPGYLLRHMAALSTIALLHAPLLHWLRRLWTLSPIDEVMLSMFTPVVIAGLLYLRRDAVRALNDTTDADQRSGLVLLAASLLIAFISVLTGSIVPLAFSAPMSIHGYLTWTRGSERVRPLLIPIYLVIFLVPGTYGELADASIVLQYASAHTATMLLQLIGLPSWCDGIVIITGNTTNHVTEACSGMSTLTTLMVYGLVFGDILKVRPRHLVVSLVSILVLALLANASRIAAISTMLFWYGEEVANGPMHNGVGYIAFGCAYALLFVLMRRFARLSPPNDP
ncbi:MAG: exosortase/archaeosortase family protein [Myxococcota bacterium]